MRNKRQFETPPPAAGDLGAEVALFRGRRVLVLGDAMVDEYLRGDTNRLSPEAPVPILKVHSVKQVLGGAANTAANIASLGGMPTLICQTGDDEAGEALGQMSLAAGIDCVRVRVGGSTLRKIRVIGQQQQIVRLDYEEVRPLSGDAEAAVLAVVSSRISATDILVISDYAKGFLSLPLARAIFDLARKAGRLVIVDPRPQNRECYRGCDYLTPNWRESRALLGLPEVEPSEHNVRTTARSLAASLEANVVLTLGSHGIWFCSQDASEEFSMPTLAREVFDVSGAGDTVVATLALARASGLSHRQSITLATQAASIVVGKFGTATVTPEELVRGLAEPSVVTRHELEPLVSRLRAQGRRVVTINGAFDVLHRGHLHILREARRCGDVLIVGLNSDASVRAYKGPRRPLVPEDQRAAMLLALRMVDYVHVFDEPDPIAFLSAVKPDVHVNGADYGEDCIESETVKRGGGRLHLVDRLPDLSTSRLFELLAAPGGAGGADLP